MSNISYGVILIKKEENENKILMINRKDSLCYIDFIRGKYKLNNLEYINKLFSRMSKEEIENIKTQEFSKLWKSLWNIKNNNYLTKKEYIISNNKLKIFSSIILTLGILIGLGGLNSFMSKQIDDRMINMWEHQREGVGIILGSIWVWFSRRLITNSIK